MPKQVNIEESWFNLLKDEFEKEYFKSLREFISSEYESKTIYPSGKFIL